MKKYLLLLFILGFPIVSVGQDMVNLYKNIVKAKNPAFNDEYELSLTLATKFILENRLLAGSREYKAAEQIVVYWKTKEIWFKVPTNSKFHESLKNDPNWSFISEVALTNYILNQKINKNRFLKCTSAKKKKEIQEVQLQAAKIVLQYSIDNKISLPTETQKYLEAYNNKKLEKLFLKK
jgi:hypothetical protein